MPNYWPIGGGGGGSQTPWTQNVNASGFQLQNCPEVINNATTGGATGITLQTNAAIDANCGGPFEIQTGTGVGINNPGNPAYPLDVSGDINTSGVFRLNGVATGQWTAGTAGAIYYTAGKVGIGVTAPQISLEMAGTFRSTGVNPAATSGAGIEVFYNPGASLGQILSYDRTGAAYKQLDLNDSVYIAGGASGNVGIGTQSPGNMLTLSTDSAAKPSTNTWTISSDIRTKRNVQSFKGDIEVIRKLEPIVAEYNGLAGTPKGQRVVSFDAAELRKLVPPCVSSTRAKLREGDEEETDVLGVNTHELFFHLIRAVQDIDRRLQAAERGNGSKRK